MNCTPDCLCPSSQGWTTPLMQPTPTAMPLAPQDACWVCGVCGRGFRAGTKDCNPDVVVSVLHPPSETFSAPQTAGERILQWPQCFVGALLHQNSPSFNILDPTVVMITLQT